ncbi:MAG: CoA-transferase [Chloroflexi bacterium]|nr:MAG: CoA-transferase [Chloroflexota bacterium]
MTETLTPDVVMPIAMARLLRDGETVFHGVASPLPMIAILVAKRLHAPNLTYLSIVGGPDPTPTHLPQSTVDPALLHGARSIITLTDIFDLSARGELDVAFLSGVQIDRRGRINMSVIGERGAGPVEAYRHPKVRLPGGAGSAAILPTAKRTISWRTKHNRRTFVEQVPFVTAAGNIDRVVTPLCVFVRRAGVLEVESIHPYSSADEVRDATGWPLEVDDTTPTTPPPTAAELAALEAVDPAGIRRIEFR